MSALFINCDWGTTHFRLRAVLSDSGKIVAQYQSDEGVGLLAAQTDHTARDVQFRAVLEHGLSGLQPRFGQPLGSAPVVISGMASSSIGWHELPYAFVPFSLAGSDLVWKELEPTKSETGAHRVLLISGLRTNTDVLRGEETHAVGVYQLPSALSHTQHSLLILPGTHCKHVQVEAGQIVNFRTFMTGELFEVLGKHSILKHSLAADAPDSLEPSPNAIKMLREGVGYAQDLPLSAALFRVRTRQLLDRAKDNDAFLSGVLIGSELAYLRDPEFNGLPILVCAASRLRRLYAEALDALGLSARATVIPPEDAERVSALGQARFLRHLGISSG